MLINIAAIAKGIFMDVQNRTLQQLTEQPEAILRSFNSYLTIYAINLAHRFPDVSDLNVIDVTQIKGIAEFCAVCSGVALETWDTFGQPLQQRRQSGGRVTRQVA